MAIRAAPMASGSLLSSDPPFFQRIINNRHCFLSPRNPTHSTPKPFLFIHFEPTGFALGVRPTSRRHSKLLSTLPKAADSTQPSSVSSPSADKTIIPDDQFSVAKVSFGVIGLSLGVSLLGYGFGAYFNILPGSEWSAIMLTYGFPLAIIGMALKYAELKPVPCVTYSDALQLRETSATPILKQVRNDVIRYRYGDEQHLEEALKRIFQYGLLSPLHNVKKWHSASK